MKKFTFLKSFTLSMLLLLAWSGWGQIAAWDFTGANNVATWQATSFNSNLISTSGADNITRGPGAPASTGVNSFRTQGFQNDGISVTNSDYFQITLEAVFDYEISLSSIDARVTGTASYAVSPGVENQFAYSLNGTDFTLIGSPSITIGTNQVFSVDLTGVSALQEVASGTTIYLRYYASGQTATGGWGFFSNTLGNNGLAINGTVTESGGTPTVATPVITPGTSNQFAPFDVEITTATEDATIFYSFVDDPYDWTEYNDLARPQVTETSTIWAYAEKDEMTDSDVASATYTFPVEVTSIAQLRNVAELGGLYKITGEVFMTYKNSSRNQKYFQDELNGGAGIKIDDLSGYLTTALEIGDGVENLTGTITHFNRMIQFVPEQNQSPAGTSSTGNTLTPLPVTLEDLIDETNFVTVAGQEISVYQAVLITVDGLVFEQSGNFDNTLNFGEIPISDPTASLGDIAASDYGTVFRVEYSNLEYNGDPIPQVPVNLTAVVDQRFESTRIFARAWDDFEILAPLLSANPLTLSGFSYNEGSGPSTSQSFSLSGINLDPADGNITVTGSSNFEVSDDDNSFSASVQLPYTGGELAATNVYVRLKSGLAEGNYDSETIEITGGGATQVDVTVSGEVAPPPPGVPYTQNFSGFDFAIDTEVLSYGDNDEWSFNATGTSADRYLYKGNWGSGTAGGFRGNANVLGYQHTGTTGIFTATLTLLNNTGSTIEELFISYMGMVERTGVDRSPEWTVEINDVEVTGLFYSTVDGVEKLIFAVVEGLSIQDNEIFTISWSSDRGEPSGASKQIGIGDVNVAVANPFVIIGAADIASNYASWIDGSNEGYGFEQWSLNSGGNAGFFLGNPSSAGISGMADPSFGLWANPADPGNFANADRSFIAPLGIGSTFSVDWGVNWDSDGAGNKGLNLYTGGISGTEIININMGGSAAITINGNPMFNNYGTLAMTLNFEYVSEGQLRVYGTGRDGSESYDQTLSVAGAPDAVRFYASELVPGDERQPYFNNLIISTDPAAIPQDATVSIKGQVSLNTDLEVENLFIEEGQYLQVNPNVNLTVNGILSVDNGSKSLSGLRIKSDETGTGSLIHFTEAVEALVERYIAAADWADSTDGWHLISAPVSGQAIEGSWTPGGDLNDYDFYAWDESEEERPWLNQKVGTNEITQFNSAQGYLVAYQQTDTKMFEGPLHVGDVAFSLKHTALPPVLKDDDDEWEYTPGWNLMGNPYASGIDWSLIDHDEVTSLFQDVYAYVYDTEKDGGAGYVTINGALADAFIAAHQGFFVLAKESSDNVDFTFTNDMRVHGGTFLKSEPENYIHLRLAQGGFFDETTIWLKDEGKLNRDRFDALKLFSFHPSVPQVYTKTQDNVWVSVNSIPEISESLEIPVSIRVPANGAMTLSIAGLDGDFAQQNLILLDLLTGEAHDLGMHPEYGFTANVGDNPNRFLLKFEPVGVDEIPGSDKLRAYTYGDILYVMNAAGSKALVEVYNVQGQVVISREIGTGLQSIPVQVAPGAYIVRMITDGETATRKVVIQ